MSHWLTLEVDINKRSKVSVKRSVHQVWGSDEVTVTKDDKSYSSEYDTFHVSICDCGKEHLDYIKDFIDNMKSYDYHCNVLVRVTNLVVY